MSSMTHQARAVIGGVDTHAEVHQAAVLDEQGRLLAVQPFPTTEHGHRQMELWMRGFGKLLVTAPAAVREAVTATTLAGKATQVARWRPDPGRLADPIQAARTVLRSLGRRIQSLSTEIATLEQQLSTLVEKAAPRTLQRLGVGTIHAAQLLVTAGQNIDRLHGETAFAHLCGVDPIPASSGKTQRHRLNPGGDRAANRTLYLIAVVRLRYCERTRAYTARRTAEGKTKKETIRCLKRYIAREVYHTLSADLKDLASTT